MSESWAVKGDCTIAAGRLIHDTADREIVQHGAVAMQEHDWPALAALDVVQPCSADADEAAQWRISTFGLFGMTLADQGGARQTDASQSEQATDASSPSATRYCRKLSKCCHRGSRTTKLI